MANEPSASPLDAEGSCWNCGLLCRRDTLNTHISVYYEITNEQRERNNWFTLRESHAPRCYAEHPIEQEIAAEPTNGTPRPLEDIGGVWHKAHNEAATIVVRRAGRNCDDWIQHKQGLGPEAHLMSLDVQRREKQQREWERLLNEDAKKFQVALDESSKRFQQEIFDKSQDIQTKMLNTSRSQRNWTVAAVVGGTLVAMAIAATTIALTRPEAVPNPLPVVVINPTATATLVPSPSASAVPTLTLTPSPVSTPGTASSPQQGTQP